MSPSTSRPWSTSTGPATGALQPDFDSVEKPLDWDELAAEENLDGLSEEQLETFGSGPCRSREARCAMHRG